MLITTLRFNQSLNKINLIGIILVLAITPFVVNEAFGVPTDEWQVREVAFFSGQSGTELWTVTPPLVMSGSGAGGFEGHIFKVFNKTDIIGNILLVDWETTGHSAFSPNNIKLRVADGAYDKDSFVDFPLPVNVGSPTYIGKGAGALEAFDSALDVSRQITQLNMTLTGSTQSQVTVFFTDRHGSGGTLTTIEVHSIEFPNFAKWEFDSSAIVNMTVTGGEQDRGFVNANFTNLADVTPPVLTLIGDDPAQVLKDTFYADAGASCIDAIEGDISGNVVISGDTVDTSVVTSYTLLYDCSDSIPNVASQISRGVDVVELKGGGIQSCFAMRTDTTIRGQFHFHSLTTGDAFTDTTPGTKPRFNDIIEVTDLHSTELPGHRRRSTN